MTIMSSAPTLGREDLPSDPAEAYAQGVRYGAFLSYTNPDALIDCPETAVERVEIFADATLSELQGIEYSCVIHTPAVFAAAQRTGAYVRVTDVGEFERAHTCGQVVSYVGGVDQ